MATANSDFVRLAGVAERDEDFHVISLRKAKKHEIKHYIKETTR